MRCPQGLKAFLSSSLAAYVLAAVIFGGVVNYKDTVIQRMNSVLEWGDYPAQLERGAVKYDERRLRFAVRYYKLVAEILPQSDQPVAVIGYCYARLGENALAVKYYQKALGKNRDHFWLEYDLGILYYRMKDPVRAYAAFGNITGRDIKRLVESSVLSPLQKMPEENRKLFFMNAGRFALDLRQKSLQMMARIDFERSNGRVAAADAGIVLHPWAFYIQPGKELFF